VRCGVFHNESCKHSKMGSDALDNLARDHAHSRTPGYR
jgi:hypothetical protein